MIVLVTVRQSGHKDSRQNQAGSEDAAAAVQRDLQHGEATSPQHHSPL